MTSQVPGVDSDLLGRLEVAGIKTTKALFNRAATRSERRRLAEVAEDALNKLVRLADLARIRGMGRMFVRLFSGSGADCVAALAACDPGELHVRLHAVNCQRALSSVVPSLKDVTEYVEMAKELPRALES